MTKTPSQKWNESILIHKKNCQQVTKISKSIRYVGVINQFGRTLTGLIQPGTKPSLKAEQVKNEFFIISNLITLRNDQTTAFGELDYIILKHKKVIIVAFQQKKNTYYVSIDSDVKDLEKIILKIKKLI